MTAASTQVVPLVVAFGLSVVIGLERELRHKVAGLRTHALVGTGAALFMLVSKYGFDDILHPGTVVLNPGQVAGQIVTGIGFLGGGIIFVRRGSARGVITAASVWVVAAVGMAAGAALYLLAVTGTALTLITTVVFTPLTERMRRDQQLEGVLSLTYRQGTGVLRQVIADLTQTGCSVQSLQIVPAADGADCVCVSIGVLGTTSMADLTTALAHVPGVLTIRSLSDPD